MHTHVKNVLALPEKRTFIWYTDIASIVVPLTTRKMAIETLKMAMAAMADQKSNSTNVAKRLGITPTTLYEYVNGDGSVKEKGQRILDSKG